MVQGEVNEITVGGAVSVEEQKDSVDGGHLRLRTLLDL